MFFTRPWMRGNANTQVAEDLIRSVTCDILFGLSDGLDMDDAKAHAMREGDRQLRMQYGEMAARNVPLDPNLFADTVVGIDPQVVPHSANGLNTYAILEEVASARQMEIVLALADMGSSTEVGEMFGITKQSVESARKQVRRKFNDREAAIT